MAVPSSVDEYLASLPDDRRTVMEELRRAVVAAAPGATETIAYQMPGLRVHGRLVVSYAAFRAHYSLFPASRAVIETLGEDLDGYLAGKGTIRLSADRPLPLALVARIVAARLDEVDPDNPR